MLAAWLETTIPEPFWHVLKIAPYLQTQIAYLGREHKLT